MTDSQVAESTSTGQPIKTIVVGVWLVVMIVAGVIVFSHRTRVEMAPVTAPTIVQVSHPNIDGVAMGALLTDAAVQKLVKSRKPKHDPGAHPKDVTVDFSDGSSMYYNSYGEVGGLEGTSLQDGDQVVAQVGEQLADVEKKLGKPERELLNGTPRSVIYLLSPGICSQMFVDGSDKVVKLNLYGVNSKPAASGTSSSSSSPHP